MKRTGWQERFWARAEPNGECLEWTGRLDREGYGRMGRGILAHRQAWAIVNGPIPPGRHVLHKCDNPACINPKHLFLGDQAINMADKARKGRVRNGWTGKTHVGAGRPAAPGHSERATDPADDRLMMGLRVEGLSQTQIGIVFGIAQPSVSRILRGESQYAKATTT